MTIVTITGLLAGGALVLAVIWVTVKKEDVSLGAIGLALVGLIMIGMSQWSTIRIKGAGVDIDISTLQQQLAETAEAVDALAEETVATATVAESTRDQLLSLSMQLQRTSALSPEFTRTFRDSVRAAPDVDTARVGAVRRSLPSIRMLPARDTSR